MWGQKVFLRANMVLDLHGSDGQMLGALCRHLGFFFFFLIFKGQENIKKNLTKTHQPHGCL